MKNNFVSFELSVKSRANESVPESFFYIYLFYVPFNQPMKFNIRSLS